MTHALTSPRSPIANNENQLPVAPIKRSPPKNSPPKPALADRTNALVQPLITETPTNNPPPATAPKNPVRRPPALKPLAPRFKLEMSSLNPTEVTQVLPPAEQGITILDTTASQQLVKSAEKCVTTSRVQLAPEGVCGALFLLTPSTGETVRFVEKAAYREPGTPFGKKVAPSHASAKQGILPGESAFAEHLASCIWKEWGQELQWLPSEIHIPSSVFCKMGHPNLYSCNPKEISLPKEVAPYSVGSSATLLSFVQGSLVPFGKQMTQGSKDWEETLSEKAVQTLALFDLAFINTDRHGGNLLLKQLAEGGYQIIPIDHGLILPRPCDGSFGQQVESLVACWANLPQVKKPLCPEIKTFILNSLSSQQLKDQLSRMGSQQIAEAIQFDPMRVKMHEIAVALIQEGARQDLSLHQIAQLFMIKEASFYSFTAPALIYDKIQSDPSCLEKECKRLIGLYKTGFLNTENPFHLDAFYRLWIKDPVKEASYTERD